MHAKVFVSDYQPQLAGRLGLHADATDLEIHARLAAGLPIAQLRQLINERSLDHEVCDVISPGLRLKFLLCTEAISSSGATPPLRLSAEESNRLARIVHVLIVAESLFGCRDKAKRWLLKPMRRFSGSAPIALLSTQIGAGLVEELLVQLADGLVL